MWLMRRTVINTLSRLIMGLSLSVSTPIYAGQLIGETTPQQYSKAAVLNHAPSQKIEFLISSNILTLLELSNKSPEDAEQELASYHQDVSQLNVAEQYLFLLTQGKIKQYYQQHIQVVDLLEQAKLLSDKIAEQQLYSPEFSDLYLILAQSLAAIGDFEEAYQAKKSYIEKFNDYSDKKRDNTVALLTKKYEIAHKVEANNLLDNENKLKVLQLGDVKRQQENQLRNFIWIFCVILIFILLFFRQFKVRKKLILLTKTDSLTGVLNRSALFAQGQALTQHSIEQQNELSVLLFDIDHFKNINDELGHKTGDLVLVEIAKLVSETMRARDVFARLAGEEFVILLPNTDIDKAKAIAVRVIEKIAQYNFRNLGIKRPITLSIGVANMKDTVPAFDDILHAADLAMYQAKQQGRNQMVNYATIAEDQERQAN
jgi:diguanylate cyclase (GGDEF)-like protein